VQVVRHPVAPYDPCGATGRELMGIYDRDYTKSDPTLDYEPRHAAPPSAAGGVSLFSVTTWLIIVNVAVYFINNAFVMIVAVGPQRYRVQPLYEWGHFSIGTTLFHFQLWRFVTFQFLHANFTHLLFNMVALYFFGPLVEMYLGRRRYLAFYLICGCFGGVGYMVLWVLRTQLIQSPYMPLVGASAGIFGILIAAAQIAPHATVLIYGVLPMRLRAMAWIMLGMAVWTVYTYGPNAGGEAAHLGGAAAGYALIKNYQLLDHFDSARARWRRQQQRFQA
jgi:membrane associated rhomboid family serine protease